MKTYEPAVPERLKQLQHWFGSIIGQPLRKDSTIQPRTPQGNLIKPETARYVIPSPSLAPYQRMQIYSQQYWWRLFKNLADNFPTACRILGRKEFEQQLACPYFVAYPPDHWALVRLGPHLAKWTKEQYTGPHQQLIYESALLDFAFNTCFVAAHYDPLSASQADVIQLANAQLYLQPHFRLFSFEHDFMRFRSKLLAQEENHWLTHPLPELDQSKRFYSVIFRNSEGAMIWRNICEEKYFLLTLFAKGSCIDEICNALETQPEPAQLEIAANLQAWMQEWVANEWLTLRRCP